MHKKVNAKGLDISMIKDRPNFGFGFGAESVDCNSHDTFGKILVFGGCDAEFWQAGTERKYIRRFTVSDCTRTRLV